MGQHLYKGGCHGNGCARPLRGVPCRLPGIGAVYSLGAAPGIHSLLHLRPAAAHRAGHVPHGVERREDRAERAFHFSPHRRHHRPVARLRHHPGHRQPGGALLRAAVDGARLFPPLRGRFLPHGHLLRHCRHHGRHLRRPGGQHGRARPLYRRGGALRRLLRRPVVAHVHQRPPRGGPHENETL